MSIEPATYTVAISAAMSAPPASCYEAIADYRHGHPAIVPPEYFGPIIVDAGGVGAGTRIHFTMRVLGQERTLRAEIAEPVPGRVLVERYPDTGVVTTFTVVPSEAGGTRVTIRSTLRRGQGVRAAIERTVTRRMLPRIFRAELHRLAAHVGGAVIGGLEVERSGTAVA